MNLEDRIRNAIERETEAPTEPDVPEGLLRRARRRIALTVAVTTLGVAAVAGGGFAAVRSIDERRPLPGATPEQTPSPTPSTIPSVPVDREAFVTGFMEARRSGSGAEEFLSPAAAEYFASPSAFPRLYGDERQEERFDTFSVWVANTDGTGQWIAYVRTRIIYLGDSPACPTTEILQIGPGVNAQGDARPLLVSSVSVVEDGWTQGSFDRLAAEEFVCAFVDARLSGSGAEAFLAEGGRTSYESSGLRLYPPEDHHWGFWWIVESNDPGSDGLAQVNITLNNTGQPGAIYESLFVGRSNGEGPVLVHGASEIPQD